MGAKKVKGKEIGRRGSMVKADISDSCGSDLMKGWKKRREEEWGTRGRKACYVGDGERKMTGRKTERGGNKNSCRQLMDSWMSGWQSFFVNSKTACSHLIILLGLGDKTSKRWGGRWKRSVVCAWLNQRLTDWASPIRGHTDNKCYRSETAESQRPTDQSIN